MLSECLCISSMRLGVPFIAPRQLGALGGQQGRPSLPSIEWCTRQSGAPLDSYCSLSGADLLPFSGTGDRCSSGPVGAPDTVRCKPDSSVPPTDCWCGPHVAPQIARPTVELATVGSPDSPVNYSRTPLIFSRE
jgi:hypothetical protein